jgi:rhamnosyltransferase
MKIGCIIVLYNPVYELLRDVINSISNQVDTIFLIDNSSNSLDEQIFSADSKIHYKPQFSNKGIAAAQNIGLEYIMAKNLDYVLFMDQDSILPSDIVKKLLNAYLVLVNNGYNVGVVAPTAINRQTGKHYKEKYPVLANFCIEDSNILYSFLKVNSCRSSGSIIAVNNFRKVGHMDESLFIDGVDNEWCWRAKMKCNLDSFVFEDVCITHQLGTGDKSIFNFTVSISSPFRMYYQYRNFIILCKKKYVPIIWKLKNGYKYLFKMFYFPVFISPRNEYIYNILRGIIDGIRFKPKNDIFT